MNMVKVTSRSVFDFLYCRLYDSFVIPDYQRPYAWGEEECQTLWDDVMSFVLPDLEKPDFFDEQAEYYLGTVVTFQETRSRLCEVIDGQQRITTLMLLLRAFYEYSEYKYDKENDEKLKEVRRNIERCIWLTDTFGKIKDRENGIRIKTEVAVDDDKKEFIEILKTGKTLKEMESLYARNYRFFEAQIKNFADKYAVSFCFMPVRIMANCKIFHIETDNQDTALTVFSTINDRGKSLSDSDIFKSQFYKYYKSLNKKGEFVNRWKKLEELAENLDYKNTSKAGPMDELFHRYMYYLRAKKVDKSTTMKSLRKFYENYNYSEDSSKNGESKKHIHYEVLQKKATLADLEILAKFWNDVKSQSLEHFSEQILKKLFVLSQYRNKSWYYLVSVYFMHNKQAEKQEDGELYWKLDNTKFEQFLDRLVGFLLVQKIFRTTKILAKLLPEMVNIVEGNKEVIFENDKFDEKDVRREFEACNFSFSSDVTRAILAWYACEFEDQELLDSEKEFHIEHILPKSISGYEQGAEEYIEMLGNKSLLEKKINIKAADNWFINKKNVYLGKTPKFKQQTKIAELLQLAKSEKQNFTKENIIKRTDKIINKFIKYLDSNQLLKKN